MPIRDTERDRKELMRRYAVIAPMVSPTAKGKDRGVMIEEAAETYHISRRTVVRYLKAYEAGGMDALRPKGRPDIRPKTEDAVLERAKELRREAPLRSVSAIIAIMEAEGTVEKGTVKRSTLQDALQRAGYSAREFRERMSPGAGSTRFQKTRRNDLWMGDIKYGPVLLIGGKRVRTYLSVLLDDYSRHVVHARFYTSLEEETVVNSLKSAFREYGLPVVLYFDNGRQYSSDRVLNCCGMLGVQIKYCRPRSPASKGKVERFLKTCSGFMDEFELHPTNSLEDLNLKFGVWLDKMYERKVHSETKERPRERYEADPTPLRFPDADAWELAFLSVCRRRADKCGCVSWNNKKFFVGKEYAGKDLSVLYETKRDDVIRVKPTDGGDWVEARKAVVGPNVSYRARRAPETPQKPSDLLGDLVREAYPDYVPPTGADADESADEGAGARPALPPIRYDGDDDE